MLNITSNDSQEPWRQYRYKTFSVEARELDCHCMRRILGTELFTSCEYRPGDYEVRIDFTTFGVPAEEFKRDFHLPK